MLVKDELLAEFEKRATKQVHTWLVEFTISTGALGSFFDWVIKREVETQKESIKALVNTEATSVASRLALLLVEADRKYDSKQDQAAYIINQLTTA